jgi:SAM-dependent methyltransferase
MISKRARPLYLLGVPAIQYLPAIAIEGHRSSRSGGDEHPMRIATRRAAGLDARGWTNELRSEVAVFFDDLATEWHTRATPERLAVVTDALTRGLDPLDVPRRLAVEIGSGIGTYSKLIAQRFPAALAVDLSLAMLQRAPAGPARRVQADGGTLPLRDASASAVCLVNAFLFPAEVDRVLSPDGALVWVNMSGEYTPIYLSVEDLVAQLPGAWTGVASGAGEGTWCVLRRVQ